MKIYHNPRCRKSREGLDIIKQFGHPFEIVEYLKNPPTETELKAIIEKLGIAPIDLVRKNEVDWKENFKGKELTDMQIVKAMVDYPKLIERPIVIKEDKAVLGRPPENIKTLF